MPHRGRLHEHGLGLNVVDLPEMLLERIPIVAIRAGALLLEHHQVVDQAQAVVLQDEGSGVAPAQAKRSPHHVGDAVGEPVVLAEGVAAVALDVHQRRGVGVLQAVLPHQATEVEPHCNDHRIGGRRGRRSTVTAATSFSNRQNASAVA